MWLGEGKRHLDAKRTTSLCIFGGESVYFSSPQTGLCYCELQPVLLNVPFTELLYLNFYSSPLSWNEQNKTFQSIFFFFNSFKSHLEFTGLAIVFPTPFILMFLQFIRKRRARKLDDLIFSAAHLQYSQIWH